MSMLIFGTSSSLMLFSAVSGFISYAKLNIVGKTKNLILAASLLSVLSAVILAANVFLIHRHSSNFLRMALTGLAVLLMLVSAIMYVISAVQISKAASRNPGGNHKTSFNAVIASSVLSFIAIGVIGASVMFKMFPKKNSYVGQSTQPQVDLEPSYVTADGGMEQLKQMQFGTGVRGTQ